MICFGCTCVQDLTEDDPVSALDEVCDHCLEICECYDRFADDGDDIWDDAPRSSGEDED